MTLNGEDEKELWKQVFVARATIYSSHCSSCYKWADRAVEEYRKRLK